MGEAYGHKHVGFHPGPIARGSCVVTPKWEGPPTGRQVAVACRACMSSEAANAIHGFHCQARASPHGGRDDGRG